jgi:hypothetical protein
MNASATVLDKTDAPVDNLDNLDVLEELLRLPQEQEDNPALTLRACLASSGFFSSRRFTI